MSKHDLPQLPGLRGKTITLGVCGGIAAYKSAELVRLLIKQGCTVHVVMTPSATQFIQPLTFQALSGRPVHVSQWPEGNNDRGMPHIDLSRTADCLLIAPATANSIAKYANGLADNLLDNLVLARNCHLLIAPAMNVEMWNNPATQRNLQQLRQDGVHIAGPASGEQACGEVGSGRMLEADEIVYELARALNPKPLAGKMILLTAGPTFEAIDPVRGITNRSTGKMGYAMAQAAWLMGAQVQVVSGPVGGKSSELTQYGLEIVPVESAKDMHLQVMQAIQTGLVDVFIGVAAVADYGIKNPSTHKQKKIDNADTQTIGLKIDFELNPDILADVGQWSNDNQRRTTVVGFAAETQNMHEYALKKLSSKKADFIIGNLAQHALGAADTQLTLFGTKLTQGLELEHLPKLDAALKVLEIIQQTT
ncbi:MAG: bifunctional phosphopantothenoylcysteine decarboxylase/phosphopantothenate--cysteine ligase CoaBC [Limnobacter sp.]|nr:bifunctional phosphopantothenoylcysteine decarboxylase/phosphopantothenate--cysteine ligase CoaBC [Limnobacter sp.]